jgi:hypothetical protein
LATLKGEASNIEKQMEAAKEKNAAKEQELFKTQNNYPAEVSALICCLQFRNTDCCFV